MAADGALRPLLGNHDLHLLATAHGVRKPSRRDTLDGVLHAPDSTALLDWLRQQPLAHAHTHANQTLLMVHAGVLPAWSVADTLALAAQVQTVLRGPEFVAFCTRCTATPPTTGAPTWRAPIACAWSSMHLTRLRFCSADGVMDFDSTESAQAAPPGLLPWFDVPGRRTAGTLVAFGHWSTLGWLDRPDAMGLDTGCVWGGCLERRAFGATLAERERLQVQCPQAQKPG